jgi:hypothetical protein
MYNPTINQKKRESKTNFHQNCFEKKSGRPEEEKLCQETGLLAYPKMLLPPALKILLPIASQKNLSCDVLPL